MADLIKQAQDKVTDVTQGNDENANKIVEAINQMKEGFIQFFENVKDDDKVTAVRSWIEEKAKSCTEGKEGNKVGLIADVPDPVAISAN